MRNSCKTGGGVKKKKYNAGGGATPDPNIYRLNKTGVFGKYTSKDISKEKFDRINNRLSRDTDNTKYGTSSSPREGISKEGIGQREISVDRANRDIIKAKQEKAAKAALEAAKERARAALKKQYEDSLRESKPKIMKRSGGATKKKYEAGGGIIPSKPVMTAPMQGRLGNRPVAGGNMAKGGPLKAVDASKNPGLAKLPTEVRNNMGYAKKGGAHPGFKAVKEKIAKKQGISGKAAAAILAAASRNASASAKKKNPRLKKVKG